VRWCASLALTLALVALGACTSAGAPPKPVEVLASSPDADARREAARELGEKGTMTDAPVLVRALRDADPAVRAIAQVSLWQVWTRSGDSATDRALLEGIELLQAHQLREAVQAFTRVIERRPDFAEGWNKRATAYYLLGEYRTSLADCGEVLKRNPDHFGALSGSGMNYLELDEPARALEYFERALAVNPNLGEVEETVQILKTLLQQQRRNAV
jgi:tetratricopeptide (TPR) repeat protein